MSRRKGLIDMYRCKQCAKEYETRPEACECGNTGEDAWEEVSAPETDAPETDAPQTDAANTDAPPREPDGEPEAAPAAVSEETQAAAPAAVSEETQAASAPAASEGSAQKKPCPNKKKTLIIIAAVLAAALLITAGVLIWQHVSGNGTNTSMDDDDKKGEREQSETDGAAALSGTSVSMYGVTVTVPDGYSVRYGDPREYSNAAGTVKIIFETEETDLSGYSSMKAFVDERYGGDKDIRIRNLKEYTVGGRRAVAYLQRYAKEAAGFDVVIIDIDNHPVLVQYYYADCSNIPDEGTLRASIASIRVP